MALLHGKALCSTSGPVNVSMVHRMRVLLDVCLASPVQIQEPHFPVLRPLPAQGMHIFSIFSLSS